MNSPFFPAHLFYNLIEACASPANNPHNHAGAFHKANTHAQEQIVVTPFDLYHSNFFKSNLYSNLLPSNHVNLESPSALLFPVHMNAADAPTIVLSLPGKAKLGAWRALR